MTAITVTPMEPEHFGVQVEEGHVTSSHRVRVTAGFLDDLQLTDVDPTRVVNETVLFLLERVPGTAVPEEVSLDEIARDHPDFYDELRARLAA
jgi:hypothetical protein